MSASKKTARLSDQIRDAFPQIQPVNIFRVSTRAKHVVESGPSQRFNASGIFLAKGRKRCVHLFEAQRRRSGLKSERFPAEGIVSHRLAAIVENNVQERAAGYQHATDAAQPCWLREEIRERARTSTQRDERQGRPDSSVETGMPLMEANLVGEIITHLYLAALLAVIGHDVISSDLMVVVLVAPAVPAARGSCSAACPWGLESRGSARARDGSLAVSLVGVVRGWHFNPTAKEAATYSAQPRLPSRAERLAA